MTLVNYVDMAIDLVHEVKKMFPNNKIVFFAISFGSVLSSLALQREPKLVDGVLAWGQFISKPWLNNDVIQDMEKHNIPKKKLQQFKLITPDTFDLKKLKFMYSTIRKYTNGYIDSRYKSMPMGKILRGLLTSPDYKIRHLKTFISNAAMLNTNLYKELFMLDEMPILSKIEIPYLILSGESDVVCTTKEALNNLIEIKKDNITIEKIRSTGHIPSLEAFCQVRGYLDKVFKMVG